MTFFPSSFTLIHNLCSLVLLAGWHNFLQKYIKVRNLMCCKTVFEKIQWIPKYPVRTPYCGEFLKKSLDDTSDQVQEGIFLLNISLITASSCGIFCICPLLSYLFVGSSWCSALFFLCWKLIRHRCKKELTEQERHGWQGFKANIKQ